MRTFPLTRYPLLPALFFLFFLGCKKDNDAVTPRPPIVDAGSAQTIKLPLDSVMLTGSAKAVDARVVAYEWSEVSGPNIPAIVSAGLPATEVRGLTAGTYLFQLFAVDSLGNTGVDTVSITVNVPAVITLILTNNPIEINLAGNSAADFSDATAPELDAASWTNGGAQDDIRGMFRFDLSGLPANVPFASAKLTLYSNPTPLNGNLVDANYGSSNAFYIQRINSSWNATIVTFPTQPAVDTTAEVLIPQSNVSNYDLINIDVTNMVRNMVNEGNYGFMLRLQTEVNYNSRIFCSGRYSDATKYPKLVINY